MRHPFTSRKVTVPTTRWRQRVLARDQDRRNFVTSSQRKLMPAYQVVLIVGDFKTRERPHASSPSVADRRYLSSYSARETHPVSGQSSGRMPPHSAGGCRGTATATRRQRDGGESRHGATASALARRWRPLAGRSVPPGGAALGDARTRPASMAC